MGRISLPPLTLKFHSVLFWMAILPEEELEKKKSRPWESEFEVVAEKRYHRNEKDF